MKLNHIFCLFILVLYGCQPVAQRHKTKEDSKPDRLSWMMGEWEMQTPEGVLVEAWQRTSDTVLEGQSFFISTKGDTPFQEKIQIDYKDNLLSYVPTVSNQNNGQPVQFTEKSMTDSLIVFENLKHDFPQRILYRRISDTTILAAIEGVQKGQNRREEFAYRKR